MQQPHRLQTRSGEALSYAGPQLEADPAMEDVKAKDFENLQDLATKDFENLQDFTIKDFEEPIIITKFAIG